MTRGEFCDATWQPHVQPVAHGRKPTEHDALPRMIKSLKLVALSLLLTLFILFLVASVRLFTLEVNAGLQLAQWEETTYISADLNTKEKGVLRANFKGTQKYADLFPDAV